MKYLFKKIIAMVLTLVMIVSLGAITYAGEAINMDEMTMQSLEDELRTYLAKIILKLNLVRWSSLSILWE